MLQERGVDASALVEKAELVAKVCVLGGRVHVRVRALMCCCCCAAAQRCCAGVRAAMSELHACACAHT